MRRFFLVLEERFFLGSQHVEIAGRRLPTVTKKFHELNF